MARYIEVASLADELAAEGSRLKKRASITQALTRIAAESLDDAGIFAMYLAGEPFAEADPRKLNAGGALLTKALRSVSGASDAQLTAAYRRHGDLGAAAFDLLVPPTGKTPKDASLTLGEVRAAFDAIAVSRTTAIRAGLVEDLLRRSTAVEAKYLLKLMLGDMRIGVKQSLVEESIAVAATAHNPAQPAEVGAVRHAVMLEADLAGAVRRAFTGTLADARMRLFHPLGFMLASPVETPEEAVSRFTSKPEKPDKPAKPTRSRKLSKKAATTTSPEFEPDPEAFPDAEPTDTLPAPPEDESSDLLAREFLAATNSLGAPDASPTVQAFLEDKYDGMRAQLHCGDPTQPGRVAIYSRNREDVTESFPELAEAFGRVAEAGTGALILDGEILGWDFTHGRDLLSADPSWTNLATGRALPFAVLGQRIGRKRVTDDIRREIPVVFMCFDLMYADGALTLDQPLRERRARLEAISKGVSGMTTSPLRGPKPAKNSTQTNIFDTEEDAANTAQNSGLQTDRELTPDTPLPRLLLSPARLVQTADEIDRAYAEARARANEGVMLKAANSTYLPGRRGLLWVKLKRELATLDVVITGAEYGSGRKSQFLSDYTFAVRAENGELQNVGKAYSGVTDLEITQLTDWLKAHTLEDFGHFRTVEPQVVLEVAFNNIMRSDRHQSGFALRFPRILRIRDDKPVTEIDTVERVEEIYQSQVDKPTDPASGSTTDKEPEKQVQTTRS